MNLFVYTGAPDLAACTATTAADLAAMVSALANPTTAANSTTLARIQTSFPQLVLGDSEPINVYFYSSATAVESWSGNASYTVAAQLGILTNDGSEFLASGDNFTVITGGWSGRMELTTAELVNAMQKYPVAQSLNPVLCVTLQLIVTDPNGNRETYAVPALRVIGRISAYSTTAPTPAANYLTAEEIAAQYQAIIPSHVWAPLCYFGAATDEQTFGYFRSPVALTILGAQISAQTAPTGSALTVDLVDQNGVELALVSTLAAGSSYQATTFGTAYALAANSFIRARIKSVGSTIAGGYLTINLLARLTSTDDEGYSFPLAMFFGTATDEQSFGYFQARVATEIVGVTLTAQVAPVGSAITVDLLSSSGAELGQVATLAAGASYQSTDFAIPTSLAASDWVRFRIKSVGSSTAGAYLTATLITRPI